MHYLLALSMVTITSAVTRVTYSQVCALAVLVSAFAALTATGSWDYDGYIEYFQCSVEGPCYNDGWAEVERSFVWIARGLDFLAGEYGGPLIIFAYATAAIFIKLFLLKKYSRHFGIAFLAYASYGLLLHEMTQIRVGLAIAFVWLALVSYHLKNRRLTATAYLIIAALIHSSALLAVFHLLLMKVAQKRTFVLIGLLSLASIVGLALSESSDIFTPMAVIVGGRLSIYFDSFGSEIIKTSQFNAYAVYVLIILTIFWQKKGENRLNNFEYACMSMMFMGAAFYLMFFWIPIVGLRILEFYSSVIPFAVATLATGHRRTEMKPLVIILTLALSLNLLVRNGIRTDFVLEGQAQEKRIMEKTN